MKVNTSFDVFIEQILLVILWAKSPPSKKNWGKYKWIKNSVAFPSQQRENFELLASEKLSNTTQSFYRSFILKQVD